MSSQALAACAEVEDPPCPPVREPEDRDAVELVHDPERNIQVLVDSLRVPIAERIRVLLLYAEVGAGVHPAHYGVRVDDQRPERFDPPRHRGHRVREDGGRLPNNLFHANPSLECAFPRPSKRE